MQLKKKMELIDVNGIFYNDKKFSQILHQDYGIAKDKINVIPHGTIVKTHQ
jgi:hypothetical protein